MTEVSRRLPFSRSAVLSRLDLRPCLLCLWLAIAGLGSPAAGRPEPMAAGQPGPPNIVFILIDDMGWMDLGVQGSTFYETPNIDALASRGMRFTQAYANAPVCSPSRASLMTGRYPVRAGFTGHITPLGFHRFPDHGRIIPPQDYTFLRDREVTLPEALKPAGYVSASIGKWHLGSQSHWPDRVGFDLNVGGYTQGMPPSYFFPYKTTALQWNPSIPTLPGGREGEYLTDRLTDEALAFIEEHRNRRFFLYLSHYTVHTPLEAPEALIEKYRDKQKRDPSQINPAYAAMVETADRSVGRIVGKLDQLGLSGNTAIIFFSDNGGLSSVTRNQPLRLGKTFLYEGGIRVPLIVHWPGNTVPGSVSDVPVMGADLYPTLVEMAGEAARPGEDLDGKSLAPLLRGETRWERRDLFWYYPHYAPVTRQPGAAIRSGDFKLIRHYDPPGIELYDLARDIGEQRDLSGEMPGKARQLQERLETWLQADGLILHRLNPAYDPQWRAKTPSPNEPWNKVMEPSGK